MTSSKDIIAIGLLFGLLSSVAIAQQGESKSPAKRTALFTEEGSESCLRCHSGEKMHAIAVSPHANPDHPSAPLPNQGCEGCHGPGSIHVSRAHGGQGFPQMITFGKGSGFSPKAEQENACLSCHVEDLGSTQAIEFPRFEDKSIDFDALSCWNCHDVHKVNAEVN
jgi:cytochrome c551/c552